MNKCIYIFLVLLSLSLAVADKNGVKKESRADESNIRVIGYDGKENKIITEVLKIGLECVRNLLIQGDEASGIPSLQKILLINDEDINIPGDEFSFKSHVSNLYLHNLANFTVIKADFHLIGFSFDYDLVFHVTTSGQYADSDLQILNFISLQGDGDINLEMDINPSGRAKIKLTSIPPLFHEIIDYHGFLVVHPDFHITGIMHDEEYSSAISKQISNIIEQYVYENAETVSQEISPFIMDLLNELLGNSESATWDELWKLITIAYNYCPEVKTFADILQDAAVKQGFIKNAE